jgi:predicted methyltransferase
MLPPLLTAATAKRILEGHRQVSLDLGLSQVDVLLEGDNIKLPDGSAVSFRDLERIRDRGEAIFFPQDGGLFQVAISNRHFYKLAPTVGAPTLEIDGIRMHRTKGTTPEADAWKKVKVIGIRHGRILDTCTGLGYTALAALRLGGNIVVSIERKPEVLRIGVMNPWSRGLFDDERIHLLIGDVYSLLEALPEEFFNYVIHDPPRFARAGHLYSSGFYARMHRVLREGGRVFHYTGEPGSKYRRVNLRQGVMHRLEQAGFESVRYMKELLGVICEKPKC